MSNNVLKGILYSWVLLHTILVPKWWDVLYNYTVILKDLWGKPNLAIGEGNEALTPSPPASRHPYRCEVLDRLGSCPLFPHSTRARAHTHTRCVFKKIHYIDSRTTLFWRYLNRHCFTKTLNSPNPPTPTLPYSPLFEYCPCASQTLTLILAPCRCQRQLSLSSPSILSYVL